MASRYKGVFGGINIQVVGIDELKKYMRNVQRDMTNVLPECVRDVTLFLHGRVKESIAQGLYASVAVDTGRLLNSVDFEVMGFNTARIFTEIEYAQFVEYGTSRMEARPHFRNTTMVFEPEIKKMFDTSLKAVFK